jgi:ribosomal protein S18 acetylase RimI-like enzyme
MIHGAEQDSSLAVDLLHRGEEYLQAHGAARIYAAGLDFQAPFYLGLYGGSRLSGILRSDTARDLLFRSHGYAPVTRARVLQRDLGTFRPAVDRRQLQLRRRASIQVVPDPPVRNWWQACVLGEFTRIRYDLQAETGGEVAACVTFWNMEPLSLTWGVHAMGLVDLEVLPPWRRQGIATFLLGEAFRQMHAQGANLVEVQVDETNSEARQLFDTLGFEEVDQATTYLKE